MNTTVRQPVAVEPAMTAAKQSQTSKDQNVEDGKFMNMLSDAMNKKSTEQVKSSEPSKQASSTEKETSKPLTQEKPETETPVENLDDVTVYDDQIAAVAMQMQGMLPVIKVETPEENNEATDELLDMQTDLPEITVQAEVVAADVFQQAKTQDIPNTETQAETVTAQMSKTSEIADEAAPQAETLAAEAKPESTAPRTAEQDAAPDRNINRQERQAEAARPDTDRRQTERQRPEASEAQSKDAGGETETVRQSGQGTPMHQIRDPRESAQTKFDGMLERASRELNVTAQKVQTETADEVPDEEIIAEQPVDTEVKTKETDKQAETPKAETVKAEAKVQEETKPAEQTTVQKNVKAPVTEQRPQEKISKADESLLDMTQQKAPEIKHEVIRSEPVPQQPPQPDRPDQAEQIKTQVLRNMDNKRTEFQMQLQPEELGKVNVKMVLENGKLSVEIAAVNPKSAEMLSRQAESLVASLKASGADVTSVNVVTATESSSAQMNGEYDLNNFQNRFQNKENGQSGNGRRNGTGEGDGDGNTSQTEREAPKAPQRILNYSV